MTPDRLSIPGLHHSLRLYHFADTHLQAGADTDPRLPPAWKNDPTPKLPLDNRTLLQSHLDRARNGGSDLILACGDLCHFPSPENARLVSTLLDASPVPVWTLPGNHDWFYPGQDGWEAMRDRQLPRLRNVYGSRPWDWYRDKHGLRFIALDNSTYFLSAEQLAFFRSHLDTDLPVIVLMHIPLSVPGLREATIAKHGSPILMADPSGRTREGVDPAPARETAALLREHPSIRAVLAAHVHMPYRGEIAPERPQLIPDAGYRHGYRWIDCAPA